jgi:hypothetical protein
MKSTHLSATVLACALLTFSASAEETTVAAPSEAATPAEAAAPADAATPATTATAPATTALSKAVIDAVGTPPEGKGLVVFFRPSKFTGGAIGFIVRENQAELGKLRNGNYFAVAVEPGAHVYTVHSEAKDVTNIEVEAGETYFLVGSISMGFMAGHPNLSPSDAAAFEAILPKLKPSKPLD